MLANGHEAFPQGLSYLTNQTHERIKESVQRFETFSLIIAVISIAFNFLIIPVAYPFLVHNESLTYLVLNAFNRLTKKFIENEVKCCNELFIFVGKKHGSGQNDKKSGAMLKKPEARKENNYLLKIQPKIPKIVLEQQEKKKSFGKRSKKRQKPEEEAGPGTGEEEEEKELVSEKAPVRSEYEDGLIDEDGDDEEQKKSNFKHRRSVMYSRRTNNMSVGVSQLGS
mmetsp:Transcript_1236/g.768  ORF Transcript_1236/g.768 Transcript_1236/m.768 type:complete len:225 (-) Transcript_1236:308-982(-)